MENKGLKEFAFNNKERIVSLNTLQKPSKRIADIIDKSKNNRNKIFVFSREEKSPIYIYNGRTLAFFSSKFRDIADEMLLIEQEKLRLSKIPSGRS